MRSKGTLFGSIVKGTFGVSVYTGLYQLMLLLISIISARLLDVTDFGKVSLLQSTVSLFIMFATMGLGSVAVKLIAECKGRYLYSIIFINVVLCFFAALAIYVFSEDIARYVYQDTSLSSLLSTLGVFVFLSGITQTQSSILAGNEDYKTIGKVNFFVGLLSIIFIYFMISYWGLNGWLYGVILLEVIKFILLSLVINFRFKDQPLEILFIDLVKVIKLTAPIALSSFLILPVNWYLTRELLLQNGYQEVALLNISNQWIAALTFLPIALGNAMLPIMSKMTKGRDRKAVSFLALKLNFIISFLLGVTALILAEFILSFYGDDYIVGKSVFIYILLLAVVLSLTNQLNNRIIADGKPIYMMYANLIWFVVSLPLGIWFIFVGMGVNGLLLGRFTAYLCKFAYLYRYARKEK